LVLTACLVSFITLLVSGVKPVLINAFTESSDSEGLPSRLEKTPDYGQAYINSIVFLGDSTIASISATELLSETFGPYQVWTGQDGELPLDYNTSTSNIIFPETQKQISVSSATERKKPDYIIITVGIDNGVPYCSEEKFKGYYEKLIIAIQESSPSSRIILQSIFPISKDKEKSSPGLTNSKISTANGWIEELADELSLKYLNTSSVLKNDRGALKREYDSGDGLHLNSDGYSAVLDYIRCHGYK